MMNDKELKNLLDKKVKLYNQLEFVENDPICIPHKYSKKQDIEIAGFFAAILAWGNRKSIIKSCNTLMNLMENNPYEFILNIDENKNWFKPMQGFVHRTFNSEDLKKCIDFFHHHYKINRQNSLETAFLKDFNKKNETIENALNSFNNYFFENEILQCKKSRTQKHIAAPFKKSACKKLNMFLRWMVRKDKNEIDFGIWQKIKTHQLIIPLDVHVINVANHFKMINNTNASWQTAVELTNFLKKFDANDPVKYDFALFGMGVYNK